MIKNNHFMLQTETQQRKYKPLKEMNLMDDFLFDVEMQNSEECDERLIRLHRSVQQIKSSTQKEVELMKMEERDRLIRAEGEAIGEQKGELSKLISLICKKLKKSTKIPKK